MAPLRAFVGGPLTLVSGLPAFLGRSVALFGRFAAVEAGLRASTCRDLAFVLPGLAFELAVAQFGPHVPLTGEPIALVGCGVPAVRGGITFVGRRVPSVGYLGPCFRISAVSARHSASIPRSRCRFGRQAGAQRFVVLEEPYASTTLTLWPVQIRLVIRRSNRAVR